MKHATITDETVSMILLPLNSQSMGKLPASFFAPVSVPEPSRQGNHMVGPSGSEETPSCVWHSSHSSHSYTALCSCCLRESMEKLASPSIPRSGIQGIGQQIIRWTDTAGRLPLWSYSCILSLFPHMVNRISFFNAKSAEIDLWVNHEHPWIYPEPTTFTTWDSTLYQAKSILKGKIASQLCTGSVAWLLEFEFCLHLWPWASELWTLGSSTRKQGDDRSACHIRLLWQSYVWL